MKTRGRVGISTLHGEFTSSFRGRCHSLNIPQKMRRGRPEAALSQDPATAVKECLAGSRLHDGSAS